MQTLQSLSKKIRTAHELLSVVKTMKSLAAVGIRQYERSIESLEEYYRVIDMGWQVLLRFGAGVVPQGPVAGTVCMVIASDQGMCGQFNDAILNYALDQIPKLTGKDPEVDFWTFGDKLKGVFGDAGYRNETHFDAPGTLVAIHDQVRELIQRIEQWRSKRGIERFYVCHNMVSKTGGYRQTCTRLLPLDRSWALAHATEKWPNRCLPMIGLPWDLMFKHLFRQYLFVSLIRAFAQSIAGENAARLMAMQAAERNILELVEELQGNFRELRQASITGELLDIISGFEALSETSRSL